MKFKFLILTTLSVLLFFGCDPRTPTPPEKEIINYQLTLSTDKDIIYADNGKSIARITAYLTDADGVPKSGSSITFFPSQGKMTGTVSTDQTGRAISYFDDDGQSNEAVRIVGQYTDGTNIVRDTVHVQVLPMEALVDTFFVDTQPLDGLIEVQSIDESSMITIKAHVFDANGVPVENVEVNYQVISDASGLGYISSAFDSTNAIGVSSTEFYTNAGRLGEARVLATISNDAVEALMRDNPGVYSFHTNTLARGAGAAGIVFADTAFIQAMATQSYDLTVSTLDNIIYADQGNTVSRIVGIVRDTDGNPVEGVSIAFSSNYGTINSPKLTDDAGVVQTNFSDLGNTYTQDVVARISGRITHPFYGSVTDSVNVQIRMLDDATSPNFFVITRPIGGQVLITDLDSAFTADVMAQVRDNRGVALPGVTVDFRVTAGQSIGYLSSATGVSDSTGTAIVTFTLNPGMSGTVTIESFIAGDENIVSISKDIEFVPMTDFEINAFSYQEFIYYDNGMTQARVYAVVRDLDGNPPDSVQVYFSSDIGTVASPVFTNSSGVAESDFSDIGAVGPEPATATITTRVVHPFWGERSSSVEVDIRENEFEPPRIPAFIDMSASFDELPPVGMPDTTFSRLDLFISDSNGFAVDAGTEVTFETDIGFITPFTVTDDAGHASAIFTMGDSSGIAKVYSYSGIATDSVLIRVRPMEAAYIIIPPVVPNYIVIQGGWGAESTTLFAEVRDARGELVDVIYDVTFSIGPTPAGSNLNGEGNSVTVETNYGVASVTLNSGSESGPVQLTVSTTNEAGDPIRSTGIPVVIRAGLPAHINADVDVVSIEQVGGGFYQMEVAALVWDQFTNPVEDSTQVYWSVIPDTIIDIIGESYTYNENIAGDAYHGMAWSKLYYNSGVIFDTIQVVARTWGEDGDTVLTYVNADADSLQILPFYPGTLTVTPSVSFHDFGMGGPNPFPVTLTATLIDYYGNPIFGGRILFQAIGFDHFEDMDGNVIDPPIAVTDEQGTAQVVVFFDQALCTPNFNNADPPEVTSYDPFTAYVWGTLIDPQITSSEQMSIELRRSIPE
ncbi:MAG: hypothetical protein U9Q77_11035 [Candidatus Marinimicrobia bacterium]|nr:hypothetical protein [Candidatus Neomarinimicrobiota bacterium]